MKFSGELDPDTVNNESFVVAGPDGVVAGKLSVSDDTITFVADSAWSLLADYGVTLAPTIADAAGVALSAKLTFGFQTREGLFRQPQRLSADSVVNLSLVGNRSGYAAVSWSDGLTPSSVLAAVFDPTSAAWKQPTLLESDSENSFSYANVGFNDEGESFAIAASNAAMWTRFDGMTWTPPSHSGLTESRWCALADDGTAMTIGSEYDGNQEVLVAQSLSAQNVWSPAQKLQTDAQPVGLQRFNAGFVALYTLNSDRTWFTRQYDDRSRSWLAEKQLTTGDQNPSAWSFASEESILLMSWIDATSHAAIASLFDGSSWSHTELGLGVTAGTHASVSKSGLLVAWVNNDTAYVAHHDPHAGWTTPTKLGATTTGWQGLGAEIDSSGNALAAWADGSDITWRRERHSSSAWSAPQALEDQDPSWGVMSTIDASGNVILVWQNALGVWATRFE